MSIKNAKKYASEHVDLEKIKSGFIWLAKLIGGGLSLVLSQYFANECGINLTFGPDSNKLPLKSTEMFDPESYMYCKSVEDRMIWSLYKSTEGMSFDSDRRRVANSISEKAVESVDQNTKMLAISLLEKIAAKCDFNSAKREIMDHIVEIGDSV